MATALIVEYFAELPQRSPQDKPLEWRIRWQAACEAFKKRVAERYNEGTLLRLLRSPAPLARRAAALALGLSGSWEANVELARILHDDDADVRKQAEEALWLLWFRADGDTSSQELQRLTRIKDRQKALAGLEQLIARSPKFAEAYNQRAILLFRMRQFERSIADCEKVLELNPYHFGALSGMGQCYLQLNRTRAALKAYRQALRVHPHLDGIADTIRALESVLGEEERKDDKK
jgi:tetratricopeptide (TPR) repeat protein